MDNTKIKEPDQKLRKMCDCCKTWLNKDLFYRNKAKNDGLQNKCIDCIKDYKIAIKSSSYKPIKHLPRDIYYIPDIYLVGYGRTQTYQHCCLSCEKAFFCHISIKEKIDLYCDLCCLKENTLAERNLSKINYIGIVVGWLNKIESPKKSRSKRNYKKVYERDHYTCQYCGYNLEYATSFLPLHIDHLKPWSAHGSNSMDNLCVSCQTCNLIASDKWFSSFEEKKEYINFERTKQIFRIHEVL